MNGMESPWKETAWNGIRFKAPGHWEPVEIGNRYLMFEDDAGPTMEVKWELIKGVFSHQKHFRRLAAVYRKQSNISIEATSLPERWQKALKGIEGSGFRWSGNALSGDGVILYCPECRRATLIQIYRKETEKTDGMIQKLLTTFKDHSKNGRLIWSIFDIRAVLPETFRLIKHDFKPGEFSISLAADRLCVTLHRWSPAAVLLSQRDLKQFAKLAVDIPDSIAQDIVSEDDHLLKWEVTLSSLSSWSRWSRRIKRKPMLLGLRLWHEKKKNRILGIRFEGNISSELPDLDNIVTSYEST